MTQFWSLLSEWTGTCLADANTFFSLFSKHQQQVAQAVERAKQVTMAELNAIIGVRGLPGLPPTVCITSFYFFMVWWHSTQLSLCNLEMTDLINQRVKGGSGCVEMYREE